MSAQHTPAPWHVGMRPGPIVYGPNGEQIADLRDSLLSQDEQKGNLCIIHAAPDMLIALEAVEAIFDAVRTENITDWAVFGAYIYQYKDPIHAAIQKAKGQ